MLIFGLFQAGYPPRNPVNNISRILLIAYGACFIALRTNCCGQRTAANQNRNRGQLIGEPWPGGWARVGRGRFQHHLFSLVVVVRTMSKDDPACDGDGLILSAIVASLLPGEVITPPSRKGWSSTYPFKGAPPCAGGESNWGESIQCTLGGCISAILLSGGGIASDLSVLEPLNLLTKLEVLDLSYNTFTGTKKLYITPFFDISFRIKS
jgi:hypothetical protein